MSNSESRKRNDELVPAADLGARVTDLPTDPAREGERTSCGHRGCPANDCGCGNCCCWVALGIVFSGGMYDRPAPVPDPTTGETDWCPNHPAVDRTFCGCAEPVDDTGTGEVEELAAALDACREQRADLLELLNVEREQHADALVQAWHHGYGAGSSDVTDGWLHPGSPRTACPYRKVVEP